MNKCANFLLSDTSHSSLENKFNELKMTSNPPFHTKQDKKQPQNVCP